MQKPVLTLLATTLLVGAPSLAETLSGSPCVFRVNGNDSFLLRTSTGSLIGPPDLFTAGFLGGCPEATSAPTAVSGLVLDDSWAEVQEVHLTYAGRHGVLHDLSLVGGKAGSGAKGEWRHRALNAPLSGVSPALGQPSTLFHGNAFHVVYRDVHGYVVDLPLAGKAEMQRLNFDGAGAPKAGQDPVQVEAAGTRTVFYPDAEGVVWELRQVGPRWVPSKITNGGLAGGLAPAAGGPLTAFTCHGKFLNLVYGDATGRVIALTQELAGGTWTCQHLTLELEGCPPASLDRNDRLACQAIPAVEGAFRVAYRTGDGRIIHLRVAGSACEAQLLSGGGGALTQAAKAGSGPVFQGHPGNDRGCVLKYVDEGGHLTQLGCEDGGDKSWVAMYRLDPDKLPKPKVVPDPKPEGATAQEPAREGAPRTVPGSTTIPEVQPTQTTPVVTKPKPEPKQEMKASPAPVTGPKRFEDFIKLGGAKARHDVSHPVLGKDAVRVIKEINRIPVNIKEMFR